MAKKQKCMSFGDFINKSKIVILDYYNKNLRDTICPNLTILIDIDDIIPIHNVTTSFGYTAAFKIALLGEIYYTRYTVYDKKFVLDVYTRKEQIDLTE